MHNFLANFLYSISRIMIMRMNFLNLIHMTKLIALLIVAFKLPSTREKMYIYIIYDIDASCAASFPLKLFKDISEKVSLSADNTMPYSIYYYTNVNQLSVSSTNNILE